MEGKKKDACRWFLKGTCNKGNMCVKKHDEEMKRRRDEGTLAKVDEKSVASEASASRVETGGKQTASASRVKGGGKQTKSKTEVASENVDEWRADSEATASRG